MPDMNGKLLNQSANEKRILTRSVVGGIVGNVLEWYDFALFGYFAPIIGEQFFPARSPTVSLMGALGVFAAAYVMRPIGGLVFGYIGDRYGRKSALLLSVLLMAIPTTLLGLLPTYDQIGVTAGVLLVLVRLVQGVSVGGELIGSICFVTESAPVGRRGFFGSWSLWSSTAGVMLGSLVAMLVQDVLTPAQAANWGWRVPFIAGSLIAVAALWMRSGLLETPDFEKNKNEGKLDENPLAEVVRTRPTQIASVGCLVVLCGGGFYMLFVWWPTLLSKLLDPPVPHALLANTLSMIVVMVVIPYAGALSDVVGRRPVLVASSLGIALSAVPLFLLVDHGTFLSTFAAQLVFAILIGFFTGPIPATMVELFPVRTRFSGMAIGYNLSLCIFGGTAPLVATWLVHRSNMIVDAAAYLSFLAIVSFMASLALPSRPVVTKDRLTAKAQRIEMLRQHIQRLERRIEIERKANATAP